MSLDAAYTQLGLTPALEWESKMGEKPQIGWENLGQRRTGTTLQTLVEMYLDLSEANRKVGLQERHRVKFICITLHSPQSQDLRNTFKSIHSQLGLDVLLKQTQFIPMDRIERQQLRGDRFYSWAVFCDHAVKESGGLSRNDGPFRFTRIVEKREANRWMALDRDGEVIGLIDDEVQKELLKSSTCPITVRYWDTPKVQPTTYPGFMNEEFNRVLHLQRAFVL